MAQSKNNRSRQMKIVQMINPARRGLMLDLARERTFCFDWTRALIRDLPRYGTNELHLYLETRFAFPSLPNSHPAGVLTPAQARMLQAEGGRVGVRIVPQIN